MTIKDIARRLGGRLFTSQPDGRLYIIVESYNHPFRTWFVGFESNNPDTEVTQESEFDVLLNDETCSEVSAYKSELLCNAVKMLVICIVQDWTDTYQNVMYIFEHKPTAKLLCVVSKFFSFLDFFKKQPENTVFSWTKLCLTDSELNLDETEEMVRYLVKVYRKNVKKLITNN